MTMKYNTKGVILWVFYVRITGQIYFMKSLKSVETVCASNLNALTNRVSLTTLCHVFMRLYAFHAAIASASSSADVTPS